MVVVLPEWLRESWSAGARSWSLIPRPLLMRVGHAPRSTRPGYLNRRPFWTAEHLNHLAWSKWVGAIYRLYRFQVLTYRHAEIHSLYEHVVLLPTTSARLPRWLIGAQTTPTAGCSSEGVCPIIAMLQDIASQEAFLSKMESWSKANAIVWGWAGSYSSNEFLTILESRRETSDTNEEPGSGLVLFLDKTCHRHSSRQE